MSTIRTGSRLTSTPPPTAQLDPRRTVHRRTSSPRHPWDPTVDVSRCTLENFRPADRRRILVAGGVAVLAIVTVILSVIALRISGNPSANASQATSPSETPTTTQAPDPTATSTPSSVVLVPPTRLLAAFDAAGVSRYGPAACPDPRTTFEVSSDGGVTWEGSDVAESTDSTAALNPTAGSSDVVHMVTLTAECAPQYLRSFVGGIEWQVFNSDLPVTWYFDPADGTTVNTPQGARSTPCTAVSMAATGSRAAVLCTDSTIFVTEDSAASWSSAISVRNAAAIGSVRAGIGSRCSMPRDVRASNWVNWSTVSSLTSVRVLGSRPCRAMWPSRRRRMDQHLSGLETSSPAPPTEVQRGSDRH